ncbi:SNF2 chromatin remodeling protein [Epithele typhae]|uniref:SNF2 chromatin remodeling protein n=1 Tax=Epithele typhae TaxID=378194 RepID=UPI002007D446|nr:SNF2 chromatin remodeling protein [Epithele typhae]KAH9923909.1 SNF2 chromatin remodeling protein [Epithele typhae]
MTSRLDRLLLLLDTGSSASVRTTAAKQLAQLAAKSVITDVSLAEDDVKTTRHHVPVGDPAGWAELMAVMARILPYLHSRSHETRSAAATALSHIFTLVPLWIPYADAQTNPYGASTTQPAPEFPPFSVRELMEKGTLLLASSGKEFTKPTGILANSTEVKKARKEAMGRLGLDFLDSFGGADDMDIDKELAADEPDADVEMAQPQPQLVPAPMSIKTEVRVEVKAEDNPPLSSPIEELVDIKVKTDPSLLDRSKSSTPVAAPSPATTTAPEDTSALSARERNRLKRKRKPGNAAVVGAPPPTQGSGAKFQAAAAGPTKARLVSTDETSSAKQRGSSPKSPTEGSAQDRVAIDPTKGGAIAPKLESKSKALEVEPGTWIWDGLVKLLEVDLFSAAWEVRHGAAMALREVLKLQGKFGGMKADSSWDENLLAHEKWCNDLAVKFLCIFVLDRFGDFVSDQVIAPVRETVSQTMASLLLHMPRRSVLRVHNPTNGKLTIKHGDRSHVWEYEVAVRSDLVSLDVPEGDSAMDVDDGKEVLRGVVDAAVLGLGDRDDDVRSVAASCYCRSRQELSRVLAGMKDDLSSSVGAVMDLLGQLVAYSEVIEIIADEARSTFVEERCDIREATLTTWKHVLDTMSVQSGWMEESVTQPVLLEWYAVLMTPLGLPLDSSTFYDANVDAKNGGPSERHNVDKNMLTQDLSLVPIEVVIQARLAASSALAYIIAYWPSSDKSPPIDDTFRPILVHYVDSTSMLQKFLAAIISEYWARTYDARAGPDAPLLIDASPLAADLAQKTLAWLQADPPAAYHEQAFALARIHGECYNLLQSFAYDCKLPQTAIPQLGTEIDVTGTRDGCFTIDTAQQAVGRMFDRLKESLGRTKKREVAIIKDKRLKVVSSIERYIEVKGQYDVRVAAAFAAAFVAFRGTPDKVSPIVKGIMNSIKNEENLSLQTHSASAVAAFVEFCVRRDLSQPPDKIVKNLCTFLCQDVEQTPTFLYHRKVLSGVLSFSKSPAAAAAEASNGKDAKSAEDPAKARLSRRGARLAFEKLSEKFGPKLLEAVPKMWQSMAGGLLSACSTDSVSKMDEQIEKRHGQDVIDSLSVFEAVVPTFHADLSHNFTELFPHVVLALRSRFAIVRQSAARCFATICDVLTCDAMRYVIEKVVPFLGDTEELSNRQGAIELIYHIVQKLDIKALPYVIFMVVPVLGRMSDPDDDVRSTATNTFASLVKMVPLEAGLPDPPNFPEDLLKRREQERQFLMQLLDGSKVEQYKIPVTIQAELRKYQQEGVNWLAFLAKYQLHGILCDDMGLGKTLQSICILASKHHERAQKYKQSKSPDSKHLPSLIVCPPTLTGHWYYEILKYTENLRPVLYTGNSRERYKLLPKLKTYDVVITSYEVVRNDISSLQDIHWHYCILDEGHIIKNAKTKLTKAVKQVKAVHRLILSGTPIQNNVLELWSLFDFLMPGFLGTESSFNERFSKPILSNRDGKAKTGEAAALALEALHKQVLPFLLRRLKEDVLHDLPPKIIQDYYCELSDLQKFLYDDFSKSRAKMEAEDVVRSTKEKDGEQQHVFQSLQYLRKLCNHPALVLKTDKEAIKDALAKASTGSSAGALSDIHHAPKLQALRQLLIDCGIGLAPGATGDTSKSELVDDEGTGSGAFSQHRVLIFCQMKQMLDIIETDLFKQHMPSVTYMRLDGTTDANKRHAVVQTFNADPSIDCLLLTTHVGGLGLTLTGADTVIFVEHDWNPMKDLQAMDRAHRIGQKKVVNVYRLITKGTLEEKIMGLQRFKLNIANSVLVLDLFKRTSEQEDAAAAAKKKDKDAGGASLGHKNVLRGLEDLPPEEEYQELDLKSFMGPSAAERYPENGGREVVAAPRRPRQHREPYLYRLVASLSDLAIS